VEPPELTGEPKTIKRLTEAERQFGEIVKNLGDQEKAKAVRPKLNEFIQRHPGHSDAYMMRALCDLCTLKGRDYASGLKDIEAAVSMHPSNLSQGQTMYEKLTDHYSLRAKIHFANRQYQAAMNDLEFAIKLDFDSADRLFNVGGVEPEKTSEFCTWNQTDLNKLVVLFAKDYRPLLFRGLYLKFFTTFKEDFYTSALRELEKAAVLNPLSPLPYYFIGELHMKAAFWTKAAWSSEEGRNAPNRKAILAFTKAVQLSPGFLLAYRHRAAAYLELKQYQQAIKDYDKVLELDPEDVTAFADRGVAQMQIGRHGAAILDFGEAIRRKKPDSETLGNTYENRAEAHMKVGAYRDAIADYSKAIERRLANDTFLLSLKQFRGLYPEYNAVSDEMLIRKINALFWPEFGYGEMAKQLLEENGQWSITFLLYQLYEKRGDAYLRAGDFRRGVLDFNRIFKGIPNLADGVDRWRLLGSRWLLLGSHPGGEEYYVDVKSVEIADNGPPRLWLKTLKTLGKKQTDTVEAYQINCTTKQISQSSSLVHDSDGNVVSSSELSSGWQRVVPDTMGERLYNGVCSVLR
jgi:tetratricopeptide (TPR) repeat protein